MIGEVLDGKYEIQKKIGEGGFAAVYRGFDRKLRRNVAIKVLNTRERDGSFQKRFLREAESMANLQHPNIVTVHDRGDYGGLPYVVMEFIDGPTLMELLNEAELKLSQVCAIARQVCDAMGYAHKHGVVHRDLTLRNIMINPGEDGVQQVKILDFGLAKLIHEESQTTGGAMLGTPYYMAPEQIRNDKVDGRVDVFAFGVGLFRMANGRFPFEAEHPASLMYLILNEPHGECAAELPEGLKSLIKRCLEKDPTRRAADFGEVAAELGALQKSTQATDAVSAVSLTAVGRLAGRGSKRNPYLNRVMIKRPSDFVGREREVRRIYSRLDAAHPQSISIVGERRIGKSSLLNYVYQPVNRQRHMQNYANAIFVYLDFQSDSDYDVPKFIDFLMSMFHYEGEEDVAHAGQERSLDRLKAVIKELDAQGKRIIILMDEFEVITRNQKFEESFFSFLRSLANSYGVAYVTSSYEDLQKMCHNKDISDSPFFNIFSNLPLRPFTSEEAMELIVTKSEAEGVPLEPHADKILDLAGHFPMYLQIACSNVFEYLVDNEESEPDWKLVNRSFMDEAAQHYQFVWDKMEAPARENLSRIAAGKPVSKKYLFVNESLERRGYLIDASGGPALCSSSFKEFALKQTRPAPGKRSFLGSLLGRRGREGRIG